MGEKSELADGSIRALGPVAVRLEMVHLLDTVNKKSSVYNQLHDRTGLAILWQFP